MLLMPLERSMLWWLGENVVVLSVGRVDVEVKNAVGWKLKVGGLSMGLAATPPWGMCKT